MPSGFVVLKGVNNWSAISGDKPGPLSAIVTTMFPSADEVNTDSWRRAPPAIASTGVPHQVQQYLLDLDAVDEHLSVIFQIEFDTYVSFLGDDQNQIVHV